MKMCVACDKEFSKGDRFCSICGKLLEDKLASHNEVKAAVKGVNERYRTLSGAWHVTTEGDVEGRSVRDLGVHTGNLVEIARKLSGLCYYSLQFSRNQSLKEDIEKSKQRDEVEINFDIDSNTWDLVPDMRAAVFQELFATNGLDPKMVETGQYYASVKLKFK